MIWSKQQEEAIATAGAWLRMKYQPVFYLAGYAGTGKTTLAKHIAELAKGIVAYAAFTGKAATVMRSKGCKHASTIHSLIYHTNIDDDGGLTIARKSKQDLDGVKLIVIDECSMVDQSMAADLLAFDIPILVLGDPAQLPPVGNAGFFTGRDPDIMLTDVHRQAESSPIIKLATEIRQGNVILTPRSEPGLTIIRREDIDGTFVLDNDIVLVGKNSTRMSYNRRIRELKDISGDNPKAGEPLVCLRNDRDCGIANGEILTVVSVDGGRSTLKLKVRKEDSRADIPIKVLSEFFVDDVAASKLPFEQLRGTQQAAFGYAITCHKSQGSQWDRICVFNESASFRKDQKSWLYTAVTRAAQHLTLVI